MPNAIFWLDRFQVYMQTHQFDHSLKIVMYQQIIQYQHVSPDINKFSYPYNFPVR